MTQGSDGASGAVAERRGTDIAVIGMAGHFPGARNTTEFWRNLRDGVEAVTRFSDAELRAAGVDETTLRLPNYVKSGAVLQDVERFDAPFFGFSPRDAAIMDPQHRHFIECAWEALENAGHTSEAFPGPIGVFGGSGMHAYLMYNLLTNPALIGQVGMFLIRHTGNDKDFLTTRVSYLLNLQGPSVSVQTACSTSLVAIHLASQSLLNGECDMALAGGVTIEIPHRQGYLYQAGEILSADGHCRAFDARSEGTIFGSGVGVVVLRRLEDALASGDHIVAVIRGSAVNNDGSGKAGYLAPSVDGQARAVAEALALSGVDAETISYVEAHGTGTPLGDPIEVAALTQAFRTQTERSAYCGLGSAKTNIGHLDTAAGVAGFIKVALALQHKQLPPSLHFERPNPRIDFGASPFYVNSRLQEWPSAAGAPRRAAVNSLGVGGTNAFAILEEAPARAPSDAPRPAEVLVLSAKTETALEASTRNLAAHLRQHPGLNLADVAYTLQAGRKPFNHRRVLAAGSVEDAIALLEQPAGPPPGGSPATGKGDGARTQRVFSTHLKGATADPSIVFMFPGGAAQYPNMGRELYETEPVYREAVDTCLAHLGPVAAGDLKARLFPAPGAEADAARALERPSVGLPAIFITEYALVRLWQSWGVESDAMTGHSLGEYACACLAGVMTVQDALSLVVLRGELFERVAEGVMLSVRLSERELRPLLSDDLSLAAVNAPGACVVSGLERPIAALEAVLEARGAEHTRLKITVPAHSGLLDPVLDEFGRRVASFRLQPPRRPWISNLTGTWITPEQATDPAYWVRHLRQPVRFSDGLQELLRSPNRVFLEVGPGQTLSSLVRAHQGLEGLTAPLAVLASTRHPQAADPDVRTILTALGRLWGAGVSLDWARLHAGRLRQRVPLPTYAFDRQRHWIEPGKPLFAETASASPEETGAGPGPSLRKLPDIGDWFSRPVWRAVPLPAPDASGAPQRWVVLGAESPLGATIRRQLEEAGRETVSVIAGPAFARLDDRTYALPPDDRGAYEALLAGLTGQGWLPQRIVHLWSTSVDGTSPALGAGLDAGAELAGAEEAQGRGFDSLLALAQALGAEELPQPLHLGVVTDGVQPAGDVPVLHPQRATVLGPVRVIPRELPGVTCQGIDVTAGRDSQTLWRLAAQIIAEIEVAPSEAVVAYREEARLAERFEPQSAPAPTGDASLRERGVYLITGGLGGIGLVQAEHLARAVQARLVLVGRSGLPPREEWDAWLATHTRIDATSRRIRKVRELEAMGAAVQIAPADVTDLEAMRRVVDAAQARFGQIDGVLHAAGVLEDGVLQLKTRQATRRVLDPKVRGALVLDALLGQTPLDFFAVFSSTSAILGPAGQVDYAAANAYLNAFAHSRAGRPARVMAVDWGVWQGVGMTARGAPSGARPSLPPLEGAPTGNALLGLRAAGPEGEALFRSHYRTDELWLLDEHRLENGTAVVPGTGYLEIAAAAATAAGGGRRPVALSDVFFLSPLAVPDGSPVEVCVSLAPVGEFTISSLAGPGWEEHARGTASLLETQEGESRLIDLRAIGARCTARHTTYEPGTQHTRQEDFVDFGPRWKNLRRVDFGAGEALARLELAPEFAPDLEACFAHPALMDLALHAGLPLVPDYESGDDFYVPFSCQRVRLYRPLPREVHSHVRLATHAPAGGLVSFDVTIAGADGRVLAEVEGFTLKRVAPDALAPAQTTPGLGRDFVQLALEAGIAPAEGAEALRRALSLASLSHEAQIVASSIPLDALQASLRQPAPVARAAAPDAGEAPLARAETSAPPRNEVERTLAGFWQDLLGLERVGIHDDFFEVGGYSLIAVRLFSRIKKAYGVDLSLSTLFEAPTIAACAQVIAAELGITLETEVPVPAEAPSATPTSPVSAPAPATAPVTTRQGAWSPLVPIQPAGTQTPFFCVHGARGNVLNFRFLAQHIGAERPFFGLQARGVDGKLAPLTRIEDMAALYLEAIRVVQPQGPYLLGGYSGGGVIAYEMARQLLREGQQTALVAMVDTFCPSLPIRRGLGGAWKTLLEEGPRHLRSVPAKAAGVFLRTARRLRIRLLRRGEQTLPYDLRDVMLWDTNLAALSAYRPQPYDGRVVLFRAAERHPTQDVDVPDLGWSRHVEGGVEICIVPGDHDSLVVEPNAGALAVQLRTVLDQALPAPPGAAVSVPAPAYAVASPWDVPVSPALLPPGAAEAPVAPGDGSVIGTVEAVGAGR